LENLLTLQVSFAPLGLLVARHLGDGLMESVSAPLPQWSLDLGKPESSRFQLDDAFPFLSVFYDAACAHWQSGSLELLRSGVWEESSLIGDNSFQLDAAAYSFGQESLLLVGPYYFDPSRLQVILQKARELHLDHEALEKSQKALTEAEARQRRILASIPDLYAIFDSRGLVSHHNHKNLPMTQTKANEASITLIQVMGQDVADQVLARVALSEHDQSEQVLEVRREVGSACRTYEARLVPMDEAGYMCLLRDVSEARELEQRKAEFLSVAGHELRTPLTAIKGGLKMVSSQFASALPAPVVRLIEIASRNSERLVTLVNDLLDLQRIELSARSFKREPISASALVTRCWEDNQPFAVELGRLLHKGDVAEDATILADADALIQVLTNLISNAVKFSPQGGLVRIGLTCSPGHATFAIYDKGPGIPESHRDRIFQKFARIPGGEKAPMKGTGLGLSIAKAIVDEHMGEIFFETAEGKGSTFFVKLPRLVELPQ